jgi:hypothetical protein
MRPASLPPLPTHTGATNSRSDRIAQALSASGDAIAASVSSGNVRGAATKSRDFALLATKENTKASDFGRKMLSGKGSCQLHAAASSSQPFCIAGDRSRTDCFRSPEICCAALLGVRDTC